MEMSNDVADRKAANILANEKPEVVTDALLKKAKKDPATLRKLAKKVTDGMSPEERAKHAAAAATLPPEERAKHAAAAAATLPKEALEKLLTLLDASRSAGNIAFMPRSPRAAPADYVYHAINRAVARSPLHDWSVPMPGDWQERVNRAETEAELEALRRSVTRSQPFGSEMGQKQTARTLELESTLRRPGPSQEEASRGQVNNGPRPLFPPA